jgi:hypothetical protein
VSNRALNMLADALRRRRRTIGTRWAKLDAGQQALLEARTCAKARPIPIWPAGRDRHDDDVPLHP